MKFDFNNSYTVFLPSGFFTKQKSINSEKLSSQLAFFSSFGGSSFKVLMINFIVDNSELGGFPYASSNAVIPSDQISTLLS